MGLRRTWRQVKFLSAAGQAANEAARERGGGDFGASQGVVAGYFNLMADAAAPHAAAMAARRGSPLPGSDDAVLNGSAWAIPVGIAAVGVRARDSAFDGALLAAFAEQVFAAAAAVWAGADPGSVRPVMSDDLWDPLAAAAGTSKRMDLMALMTGRQAEARLAGLHAGDWYDSARLAMHVTLAGSELHLSGLPPEMPEWDEDWLFQRSARPGGDPMIRPPACPSCGAPTRTGEHGRCLHCRVPVPFLTTGWLVTQIVSHHPVHAMLQERVRALVLTNPAAAAHLPPGMRQLLPADWHADLGTGGQPGVGP